MKEKFDYVVVGAGIVGLATAHTLQRKKPGATIAILDKENKVAAHQSGHNSGVIHAGVYYQPGSLKAKFCRAGVRATVEFCKRFDVPYRQCGKLIVAVDDRELTPLRELGERARTNGLSCEEIDGVAIRKLEPNIAGLAALRVADTGIVDYVRLCDALAQLFVEADGQLMLNTRVEAIIEDNNGVRLETTHGSVCGRYLIVCAGLQADRLAKMAGLQVEFSIVPFRGDYYRLPKARSDLVSTLVYPVPDRRLPFLGVHMTLTTDGYITVGPTAMLALARERYSKWAVNFRDMTDALAFGGTWRLLSQFPRAGVHELLNALFRKSYLKVARRYCPALEIEDLNDHECGVRAQAVTNQGAMVHDFLLERTARSVHVCNAPSPAATSAFPIADSIVESIEV